MDHTTRQGHTRAAESWLGLDDKTCHDSSLQISKVSKAAIQGLGVEIELKGMDDPGSVMAMGLGCQV